MGRKQAAGGAEAAFSEVGSYAWRMHELKLTKRGNVSEATIEAIVENGQIRLPPNTHLPERAKVYVVVP